MSKIETYLALAANHKDDEIIYHAARAFVKVAIKEDSEFAQRMRISLIKYIQSLEEEQYYYKKRFFKEIKEKKQMIEELNIIEEEIK